MDSAASGAPPNAQPDLEPQLPEHTEAAIQQLIAVSDGGRWTAVAKNDNVAVYNCAGNDGPCILSKTVLRLVSVSPDTVFDLLGDVQKQRAWDPIFDEIKVIEEVNQWQDYVYQSMRTPIGVRTRDFCHLRTRLRHHGPDGIGLVMFQQAEHPKAPITRAKIRAETVVSGYLIRQDCSGINMQLCTTVTSLTQTDIKGSIPRTVCNAFAARAPLAWFVRFEKECHKEAAWHLLAQGKPATPHNIKKSPPLKSLTPSASPLLSAWSTRPARRSDPGQSPFRLSGPVEPRSKSIDDETSMSITKPESTTVVTVLPAAAAEAESDANGDMAQSGGGFLQLWHHCAQLLVPDHTAVTAVRAGEPQEGGLLTLVQSVWWEMEHDEERNIYDEAVEMALREKSDTLLANLEQRDEADLLDAIMLIMQAEGQAVALVSHSLDQIIPEAAADQMAKIALSAEELDQLGKSVSGWLLELTENDAKIEEYLSDKPWDDKFLSGECEAVEVRICQSLEDVLDQTEAHLFVGDWSSAILLMLTLVRHFGFETGSSPALVSNGPCRAFLHRMRVVWQSTLSADDGRDYQSIPSRVDIADAMVGWDPTVEYRVPDNWGVLLNERRDHYFASHPVEHALVEVLELWEKLRGHTIEAMTRRCGEGADYVELIQVSSDNLGILQAEAERLVSSQTFVSPGGMGGVLNTSAAMIRRNLAAIVVINARIRLVFNSVQVVLQRFEAQQKYPELTAGSAAARAMCTRGARGSVDSYSNPSAGQHFWHQLTASKLSESVATTQDAVLACLRLCKKVVEASLPQSKNQGAARSEAECQTCLDKATYQFEEVLAAKDIAIASVLQAMFSSSVTMQQGINECFALVQSLDLPRGTLEVFQECDYTLGLESI